MSLWKWVLFVAFVSIAVVLAARKFRSFRSQLLARFPPDGGRQAGNIWDSRRHLNRSDESAADAPPEPDPKDEIPRS